MSTYIAAAEGGACGGLVVRVPASKSPVPGANLGPGPPHIVVCGPQLTLYCKTVINKVLNPRSRWAVNLYEKIYIAAAWHYVSIYK